MTHSQFIEQAGIYLGQMVNQTQNSLFNHWKEEHEKSLMIIRNKEDKIGFLEKEITENKEWFEKNKTEIQLAKSDPNHLFEKIVVKAIESNPEVKNKLKELFDKENKLKAEFKFMPSRNVNTNDVSQSIDIETLYVSIFNKEPDDTLTIGIKLDFEFLLIQFVSRARLTELSYLLDKIKEVYYQNVVGYTIKEHEIHLPEGFKLTAKDTMLKADRFSIEEIAILFHLLKKNKVILDYTSNSMATFAHYVTGYSEQNLRADGFNLVENLLDPNPGTKRNNHMVNVWALLKDIAQQLDEKIEKAETRWVS